MDANPYAYAGGYPVNLVDPSGLAPWDWVRKRWNNDTTSVGSCSILASGTLYSWDEGGKRKTRVGVQVGLCSSFSAGRGEGGRSLGLPLRSALWWPPRPGQDVRVYSSHAASQAGFSTIRTVHWLRKISFDSQNRASRSAYGNSYRLAFGAVDRDCRRTNGDSCPEGSRRTRAYAPYSSGSVPSGRMTSARRRSCSAKVGRCASALPGATGDLTVCAHCPLRPGHRRQPVKEVGEQLPDVS